jgi:glutamine synthetase
LDVARDTYVDVDIHRAENAARLASLKHLPASCAESATALDKQRALYEADGVFSPSMIDAQIAKLNSYDDAETSEKARKDSKLMKELVDRYFHCG